MPRPKSEEKRKTFQVRLTIEETARWNKVFEIARERSGGYIKEADFNRLLLGLKDDPGTVAEKERFIFQGRSPKTKMLGPTESGLPHIREVSPKNKRK